MSKRNLEPDYAATLESSYAEWDKLFTKGGSDPSWSDGVNLEMWNEGVTSRKASPDTPIGISEKLVLSKAR